MGEHKAEPGRLGSALVDASLPNQHAYISPALHASNKEWLVLFPNVLVVSANTEIQNILAQVLHGCGLRPIVASTVVEAKALLEENPVYLVFCSEQLPDGSVDSFLPKTLRGFLRLPVVLISESNDWDQLVNFLTRGAFDCVSYPLSDIEIERIAKNALSFVELRSSTMPPDT